MARLISSKNDGTETVMKSGLGMMRFAAAALVGAALVFSAGEAFAKKPIGSTIKNGIDSVDDLLKGLGKGTRALDDLGEGALRNLDDVGQGIGRNLDDVGQAGAKGANRIDDAGQVVDVPKYTAGPLNPAVPKSNVYDIIRSDDLIPEEVIEQGAKAGEYVDLQKKAAGYLQPEDALEPDDLLDALNPPGGYIKPGTPSGKPDKPDLPGGTPTKPDKGGKAKLPDKTKVAKITPLPKQGGAAAKGVHVVSVPVVKFAVPKMSAEAAKALAKKVRRIKIAGGTAGVLVVAGTTTVILYYTVEPVREFFDGTGEAVNEGFGEVSDFFTPDVKLTVDNQADGPVEIFRNDANGNLESIGAINETPGSTTVDVQQGDTVTVYLNNVQYGQQLVIDESQTIIIQ